ncbi:TRAP transporter small permease [Aliirhizobium terrae]|uniref:TRAP transporter small permease n=1 Tax=Terrirhizobium terrae TaxID=2926709 RepID=UPI002575B1BD|nr:TRAP transporter small permease [Rhizobium sp. CC-CFT758]WJH39382.1 TRAP transporter small permease [Rhizobium sp. CC-CFT758]
MPSAASKPGPPQGALSSSPASRGPAGTPVGPVRWLIALSEGVLCVEKLVVAVFMALVLGLILLNVVTRYAGTPLYWVDEAAVYAMVWLTFVGGSALTRLRLDFAVTLLSEKLSPANAERLQALATFIAFLFSVSLLVMCWNWMDPLGIAAAGFDARDYAGESFNFLYTERTQTLNWPTWMVSLIVPIFALTMSLHTAANLVEELGFADKKVRRDFNSAEGVN